MPNYIEIKTDDRVKDLLPHLKEIDGLLLTCEIDSMNYGEGYDFKYHHISIRLFDDERSEDVYADEQSQISEAAYEEVFNRIVISNSGQTSLKIEIDRLDENRILQNEITALVIRKLSSKNYEVTLLDN